MSMFGDMCRARRLELGLGLRKFCDLNGFDPSQISKVERGRIQIPGGDFLTKLADALEFDEDKKRQDFLDTGHVEKGNIPPDLLSDDEAIRLLPAALRTFRNEKLEKDSVDALLDIIKKA